MKKLILLGLLAIGCTDEDGAGNALRGAGYTGVRFTGYAMFACSKDDWSQTGFVATGPTGQRVEGAVCCGMLFKNCTIRTR